MNELRGIIKEKEEESKKVKGRPSKSAKPATKIEKTKAKSERAASPKNKSKLELKDKPAKNKIDKLNQTVKHSDNKTITLTFSSEVSNDGLGDQLIISHFINEEPDKIQEPNM